MDIKKIIGQNIRRERIKRNISIEELADMLDLSSAFIGLIERGQRGASIKNLIKISDIFSVNINVLIEENEYTSSKKANNTEDTVAEKLETINCLMYNLNINELDFVISVIRNLKHLENLNKVN